MKPFRFLVLCSLFLISSFGVAQLNIKYERFQIPNGLQVIMHEDHSTPTVSVNVWYHVGSGREKPGRTGFAHLFEHIMFEGSGHVPPGKFDEWLEAAGGDNNGSTTNDRTNYWENIPSSALEMALFLESDRMGFLLDSMTPARVDQQRDVVKNERRQSYENRPYGMASLTIEENLFPPDHPYHWPVIGSMEDLSAASYQDVVDFFSKYYSPANASLSIAGDIVPVKTKALVEKWFSDVPKRPAVPPIGIPPAMLTESKRLVIEDKVQLPRLFITFLSPPRFTPGDAELDVLSNVLAGGKNSRLYKRLVYDLQIAQDVSAYEDSRGLASEFAIIVTARSGHNLTEIEKLVWEEIDKIKNEPPVQREVQRAVNLYEASFLDRLERVGGFGGKADLLNEYYTETGNPDYFNEDLARYKALSPNDIQAITQTYLKSDECVVLSVVPQGKTELAAQGKKDGK
jgi:zinc protease